MTKGIAHHGVGAGLVLAWPKPAAGEPAQAPLLSLAPAAMGQTDGAPAESPPTTSPDDAPLDITTTLDFARAGGHWWSIGGGVAFTEANTDYNATWTWHHFVADAFEVNATVGGWYHDQRGDDAASGSLSLGFRWHFIDDPDDRFTVYADTGIGGLVSSDEVPDGGTEFNFIPRAGVGSTVRLGDSSARLDIGVRWQHISNASLAGADENPARDAFMVYFGFVFPF